MSNPTIGFSPGTDTLEDRRTLPTEDGDHERFSQVLGTLVIIGRRDGRGFIARWITDIAVNPACTAVDHLSNSGLPGLFKDDPRPFYIDFVVMFLRHVQFTKSSGELLVRDVRVEALEEEDVEQITITAKSRSGA